MEGTSVAHSYAQLQDNKTLPDSKTVNWHLKQDFGVKYPETVRPYVKYSTIGDSRLFLTMPVPPPPDPSAWNPTMPGIGFPFYRKYLPIVRFVVPYMGAIFPKIKMHLIFEKDPLDVVDDIQPQANPDGDSSLPSQSQDWIIAAGGSVKPDEELVFTQDLPHGGMAKAVLSFAIAAEEETKLDDWSCYLSRFESFKKHLTWPDAYLQVYYDSAGKHTVPTCPSLFPVPVHKRKKKGNRIDSLPQEKTPEKATATDFTSIFTASLGQSGPIEPYPEEVTSVPLDWSLPTSLTENMQPFDQQTSARFARFALETEVRFNEGEGDKLDGINDTVDDSTIEAVVDAQRRPIVLWLRTPEPVDWRRVTAALTIKHVNQTGNCPTGYARRCPMSLTVAVLPSPDASSAFLIGSFAGTPTCLPRGEYDLRLSFDPNTPNLEKLRPGASVGSVPEQVNLKFIQPFGLDWPLPTTNVLIPAGILEKMFEAYQKPWPPGPPEDILKKYQEYVRSGELTELVPRPAQVASTINMDSSSQQLTDMKPLEMQKNTGKPVPITEISENKNSGEVNRQ